MTSLPHLHRLLRRRGYRLTPQRRVILQVLDSLDGHLTVEHIHRAVAERLPGVDLSTVYRAVRLLSRLGVLDRHELAEGGAVYELHREACHGHFVCEHCGRVVHLEPGPLEAVRHAVRHVGTTIRKLSVTAVGTCARCGRARTGTRRTRTTRGAEGR